MTSTAIDFPNNRSQLDPTLNDPPFTDIPLEDGDVFIAAGSSYTWSQDIDELYGRWKNEDPGATGDGRYVRLQDDGGTQVINGGGVLSINDRVFLNGTTGNITLTGTVDGRDVEADGTKLDGIEAGATADQTGAEIKTLYEAQADTNAFTDADHTKLDGISTGATVSQWSDVTDGINYAGGNVGVGTSDPVAKLTIASGSNQIGLTTGNTVRDGTLDIGHFANGAFIGTTAGTNSAANILRLGVSGVEKMRIESDGNLRFAASGQGINFNNYGTGTNIDSNLLDDYEEGTWTPSLTGAATYSLQTGRYVKIGKVVYCLARIKVATFTSSSNSIRINGLPFPSTNVGATGLGGAFEAYGTIAVDNTQASFRWDIPNNTSYLQLKGGSTSASNVAINSSSVAYTNSFKIVATYFTDA